MGSSERAITGFKELHGRAPLGVWSAPGRVNLIGEHTDYNDGYVLPFALPHRTAVAAAPREDGRLTVTTLGDDDRTQTADPFEIAGLAPGSVTGWPGYLAGVAWVLRDRGYPGGADLFVASDVPSGAGLSSSHALQCAASLALLGVAGVELDSDTANGTDAPGRDEVALWVQRSENDFVGAPTGLLDQTASLRCTAGNVLFFDVRTGVAEQVAFDIADHGLEILVIDTRAHHSLADSEYGVRRRGCERAAALLGRPALRDVELDELDAVLDRLPDELRPLVRHVVTENDRVLRTVDLLRHNGSTRIGDLLTSSHTSMRDDYRISCDELDTAVDAALASGALGARMTGGGFGGSAIALVPSTERTTVRRAVTSAFAERRFTAPRLFTAVPSAGARRDE
ncbi:galactokinase [Herbihabitans rhizosphaerae]|uniref:galactokinase n=1 Tax=Herbihabitans rhizosphaerae TaxID=1872711 RepID=UPI003BF7B398